MKLLTPSGLAGIAVLRAAPEERERLQAMLRARDGSSLSRESRSAPRRAELRVDGVAIDEVLVVDRASLGLELHVHGSPAIVDALRGSFDVAVATPASAAEELLWHAMSREQLELALEQLPFDVEAFVNELAPLSAAIRHERLQAALRRTAVALAHVEPHRIVLVGSQNAGKSSLLNALLLRERALTGPQPGLTRDPVTEVTTLDGYPYEIVDTAGEGPTDSPVDARALAAARAARAGASTVLVIDRAVGPTDIDRELARDAVLVIANKGDLPSAAWPAGIPRHATVSCVRDEPGRIRREIGRCLREHRALPPGGRVGGIAALTRADARTFDPGSTRVPG